MRTVAASLCFLLAGCSADEFDKGDKTDAAPPDVLEPPELQPVPERTPRTTVEASGRTEGTRVVALGSPAGAIVTVVLPGGSFCQATPIEPDATTSLRYYTMAGDGRLSRALPIEVTHDPAAPDPGPPCGDPQPECAGAEECGTDEVDEDCNGWADACDLACSGCDDDAYEPNDFPVNVPSLSPSTYDMRLCPCRDDWYAFQVAMGDRVHAVVDFVHADIDIDARLYQAGPDGYGIVEPPVATSAGSDDQEEIDHTAAMPGAYFLRVYPFRDEDRPAGSYTLTLE